MFTTAAHRIGRVLRTLIMMKWKPVPFFGVALVAMLLYWAALAILR
jgi:hypothetical protein